MTNKLALFKKNTHTTQKPKRAGHSYKLVCVNESLFFLQLVIDHYSDEARMQNMCTCDILIVEHF